MSLPFSRADFFDVFAAYHAAVGILPLVLAFFGLLAVVLMTRLPSPALAITSGLWVWAALAYFAGFFTRLSPMGWTFAALFLVEAALIAGVARRERGQVWRAQNRASRIVSMMLAGYALVVYPVVGFLTGQRYPELPTFGLPCPTTILTLAIFAWCGPTIISRTLLIVPALWALVSLSAAVNFGVVEDFALIPAFVAVAVVRIDWRARRARYA